MRQGGKILIDQLAIQGVQRIFTVPGESFLPALDALYEHEQIETVVCRHEGGAAMMAEASGKLTGKAGVCFVTRGPGATNAMSGVHVSSQDSTPMVLLVGLPEQGREDRESFQEIEVRALFSSLTKWVGVVRAPERIPEYVARAFVIAQSGRPGPVVLGLPEDVLAQVAKVADAERVKIASPSPAQTDFDRLAEILGSAQRPLLIVGGPGWSADAQQHIEGFAAAWDLPVVTSFRAQDRFDNRQDNYCGHAGIAMPPSLSKAILSADVIVAIGARIDEITSRSSELIGCPQPNQRLVHVLPDASEIGRIHAASAGVVSTVNAFCDGLAKLIPPEVPVWRTWRRDLRDCYLASLKPKQSDDALNLAQAIQDLSDHLPDDTIVTNGAGNYAAFLHRHFSYKRFGTQLAPVSGSMGYGVPAAIAAKLHDPTRPVVAFAGDGCFMMTGQELATAVQYKLPIVIVVVNNGLYGTIRMRQERSYPGRPIATTLHNPDFAALACSYGAQGVCVAATTDVMPAIMRALASGEPTLIEVQIDPDQISPDTTLRALGEASN